MVPFAFHISFGPATVKTLFRRDSWKDLHPWCVTVLWFGFLCAAKEQKAPLFLDQTLLQVSARKPDVAIFVIKRSTGGLFGGCLAMSSLQDSFCAARLCVFVVWWQDYTSLLTIIMPCVPKLWHKICLFKGGEMGLCSLSVTCLHHPWLTDAIFCRKGVCAYQVTLWWWLYRGRHLSGVGKCGEQWRRCLNRKFLSCSSEMANVIDDFVSLRKWVLLCAI